MIPRITPDNAKSGPRTAVKLFLLLHHSGHVRIVWSAESSSKLQNGHNADSAFPILLRYTPKQPWPVSNCVIWKDRTSPRSRHPAVQTGKYCIPQPGSGCVRSRYKEYPLSLSNSTFGSLDILQKFRRISTGFLSILNAPKNPGSLRRQ